MTLSGTATTTNMTVAAWNNWTAAPGQRVTARPQPALSPGEMARRAEEARVRQEQYAAERARLQKDREAERRAERLLLQLLDPEQRDAFRKERAFVVVGASGKRYRLRLGWAGNVEGLDESGRPVERMCIHLADGQLPQRDNLIAQKLLLETDEARFRKIANISPAYRAPAPPA